MLVRGQPVDPGPRVLQDAHRLLGGVAARGPAGQAHEIVEGLGRLVRPREMVGEAVVHLVELLGVDALERLAHRGMQGLATRGKQIVVHDAPEPPMREIEALADGVKDATAYQLLDPLPLASARGKASQRLRMAPHQVRRSPAVAGLPAVDQLHIGFVWPIFGAWRHGASSGRRSLTAAVKAD